MESHNQFCYFEKQEIQEVFLDFVEKLFEALLKDDDYFILTIKSVYQTFVIALNVTWKN